MPVPLFTERHSLIFISSLCELTILQLYCLILVQLHSIFFIKFTPSLTYFHCPFVLFPVHHFCVSLMRSTCIQKAVVVIQRTRTPNTLTNLRLGRNHFALLSAPFLTWKIMMLLLTHSFFMKFRWNCLKFPALVNV